MVVSPSISPLGVRGDTVWRGVARLSDSGRAGSSPFHQLGGKDPLWGGPGRAPKGRYSDERLVAYVPVSSDYPRFPSSIL